MRKTISGFTIVELLIVIVVIAILAAISVVAYTGVQERAQISKAQSNLKQIYTEAALQQASTGSWPTRAELKDHIASVVPNPASSDFLYCTDASGNFAIAVYAPLSPNLGDTIYFMSPLKGGVSTATYATSVGSTWGSVCNAVLPGYTTGAWYNNM